MNIIEEMYNSNLFHVGTYSHNSEEYRKAMDNLIFAESEMLSSFYQIREFFDKYQSAQIVVININNRQELMNGFRIGEQIVLEMIKPID